MDTDEEEENSPVEKEHQTLVRKRIRRVSECEHKASLSLQVFLQYANDSSFLFLFRSTFAAARTTRNLVGTREPFKRFVIILGVSAFVFNTMMATGKS